MRFVCDSCRAQYMISDEKVGAKGVKVRCKKCGYVILVRRPQDTPPPPPPPEPSDATVVMQNPLADSGAGGPFDDTTVAGGPGLGGVDRLFGGVEEDEIGAVFDQVLSSGKQKTSGEVDRTEDRFGDLGGSLGDSSDDRMSTRVLDAATVRKLTEQSGSDNSPTQGADAPAAAEPKQDPARHDWFVAIDEKQVGPLTLEKIKQHWDEGEIGPDSLCWRAGFSDWLPLSEVEDLTSVLAPQPKKPVIVASSMEPSAEREAPSTASSPQEDTGWKPSAASALASLVKEEIEALAKPAPAPRPAPAFNVPPADEKKSELPHGLLDLPSQEVQVPANVLKYAAEQAPGKASSSGRTPLGMQHDTPSTVGPAPYTTVFRPPSSQKTSKAVVYGGAAALGVVVLLIGVVVWMMFRQQEQISEMARKPAEAPVVVAKNDAPAAAAAKPETPVQPAKSDAAAKTEDAAKPTESAKEAEVAKKDPEPEPEPKKETRRTTEPKKVAARTEPEPEPAPKPDPVRREESGGNDDDFEALFGGSGKSTPKKTEEKKTARAVYVPPAPGQQNVPERLGSSDVMQVVLSHRSALGACTAEQKKRDPDLSGTLVMRWVIQPNGRPTRVSAQSAEFKSTYLATCIGGVIKQMKFPVHKEQGAPIDFPFKF
ncbi:MAG: adventurous gliding motility protein GltJ [Myxococcaceae bacterium]